jgi:hypothetical protein
MTGLKTFKLICSLLFKAVMLRGVKIKKRMKLSKKPVQPTTKHAKKWFTDTLRII